MVIDLAFSRTCADEVFDFGAGAQMSLGALDFGLIVDGSVVMVENILRRLSYWKPEENRFDVIRNAGQEVARPVFFGVLIIIIVYVPILTLGGIEGKMFKPMAATVLLALAASLIIALTVMPILCWYAFRTTARERDTWFMRRIRSFYVPVLERSLRFPKTIAATALLIFLVSVSAIPFMGTEFIPQLDEGSIVVMMFRLPGISVIESLHGNEIIETVLREFPEVATVYCRTGRPEVATDLMGIEQCDVYIMLKPLLPHKRTKADLIAALKARLEEDPPGAAYSFSQPIQMRMQELTEAGVRSDIAAKLYGGDLNILRERAERIGSVIQQIPGAADIRAEKVSGIAALLIRGMLLSISAGVGFIALFGIAVLNGVVLITYIRQLLPDGLSIEQAVTEGATVRLRPVLMTALVASLGFIPMVISNGAGAEVQRPLATVVIGGLVTSTLLTLLVLPTVYRWLARHINDGVKTKEGF